MMEELDELRPPTAWRLLEIWRGTRELAEEPLERALLCNAQVLAESCLRQGKPVFPDGAAVLIGLTAGEMETMLRRLAGEEPSPAPAAVNRDFDQGRFQAFPGDTVRLELEAMGLSGEYRVAEAENTASPETGEVCTLILRERI